VERAFGDLRVLQGNLRKYIHAGKFYYAPVDAKLSVKESRFAARKLPAEESLALRGELLARTGRPDDARALLAQALRRNPRSAAAHEAMALLYLSLRDQEESWKHFSKAAELNPGSFLAQYYCAELIFMRDKDNEVAEKYLRKTLALNPKFVPAYYMLSRVLRVQASRLPEALDLAMKAADLEPGESRHWVNAGQILVAMGRYDEAKRIGDRRQVRYRREDSSDMSGFEPCRELEGKRVRIEYLSVAGREYSGVILTVVLEK